jgi:hypothetical protein
LLNVFRWIADPSHAKIDGDFPHSYGILVAVHIFVEVRSAKDGLLLRKN